MASQDDLCLCVTFEPSLPDSRSGSSGGEDRVYRRESPHRYNCIAWEFDSAFKGYRSVKGFEVACPEYARALILIGSLNLMVYCSETPSRVNAILSEYPLEVSDPTKTPA